ncbi:unnamed protein product, partial [Symbiodinium necroappetens]
MWMVGWSLCVHTVWTWLWDPGQPLSVHTFCAFGGPFLLQAWLVAAASGRIDGGAPDRAAIGAGSNVVVFETRLAESFTSSWTRHSDEGDRTRGPRIVEKSQRATSTVMQGFPAEHESGDGDHRPFGPPGPRPSTPCSHGPVGFPSLRGGAVEQRVRSKTDKILDGLASLLDSVWDDEAPGATEDEPKLQELWEALEDIVRTRPGNVVQRLKSLVTRFRKVCNAGHISATHAQHPATSATTRAGRDGHVNSGTKDCEQDQPQGRRTFACGRARKNDWTGPVATTSEELEQLIHVLKDKEKIEEKGLVALPNSPAEAAIMWQLLAAHEAIQVLFVFNYETQPNFAEATKESLGVEPATCSIPLLFDGGLRFVRRFTLRRGAHAPATDVRRWAGQHLDLHKSIRDSWGWERIGKDDLQGLIRIDGGRGDAFLSASGLEMGGSRWFFEPLRWESPLSVTAAPGVAPHTVGGEDIKDIAVQAGFKDVELLE